MCSIVAEYAYPSYSYIYLYIYTFEKTEKYPNINQSRTERMTHQQNIQHS